MAFRAYCPNVILVSETAFILAYCVGFRNCDTEPFVYEWIWVTSEFIMKPETI